MTKIEYAHGLDKLRARRILTIQTVTEVRMHVGDRPSASVIRHVIESSEEKLNKTIPRSRWIEGVRYDLQHDIPRNVHLVIAHVKYAESRLEQFRRIAWHLLLLASGRAD